MRFIKYTAMIFFTSFGFKTSIGSEVNIQYRYNSISNIKSCQTKEDTYYNYNFKIILNSGNSNIQKVSFLYNIIDNFSSPSFYI